MLAAQGWTGTLLTLDDIRPAGNGVALGDLGIVGSWVLRQAPAAQLAGLGPSALAAWREWNQQPPAAGRQPGRFPPASAALTGALAATAMTMLTGSDDQAIAQIRAARRRPGRDRGGPGPPGCPPPAGGRCRPRPAAGSCAPWTQTSAPPTGSATAPARARRPSRTTRPGCSPPAPGRSPSCYGRTGRCG